MDGKIRVDAASAEDAAHRVRPQSGGARRPRGLGKPETFNFLGFTHICGRSRRGSFQLRRKSRSDRMRGTVRAAKEALRRRMHEPIGERERWLGQVVRGFFAYRAIPTNSAALRAFRYHITDSLAAHASLAQPEGRNDVGADDGAPR